MARKASYALLLLLSIGLLNCDHATKGLARSQLKGEAPVRLIGGVLDLRYTENRDAGFSLLRWLPPDARLAVILITNLLAAPLVLLQWMRRRRLARLAEQLGYAFLLAGALGNLLSRLLMGYVIDFIHLHRWPIFNVADICLVVGAALLVLTTLRRGEAHPKHL
jgi:signal peptidase II